MRHIVAYTKKNRVIGYDNDLPWPRLKGDLKRFKELTIGNTVVMGRKTYESIVYRLGKPLPKRDSIVLTRDPTYDTGDYTANVETIPDLSSLPVLGNKPLYIIGGAQIYAQTLPYVSMILATEVNEEYEGDTFYPALGEEWVEISRECHETHDYVTYVHHDRLVRGVSF